MNSVERLVGQKSNLIYPVLVGTQENFYDIKEQIFPAQTIFLQISQEEDLVQVVGIKIGDGINSVENLPFVNWYNCVAENNRLIINKQEFDTNFIMN